MIGLLTLFGIGWSTALLVERPRLIVPLVTALAAYWPRSIWYKHEFIAESFLLAAFVAVVALLLTPRVAKSHVGLMLLMLAFVLLAGMKGASRFLWLGSVLALFLLHRDPRQWMWSKLSLAIVGLSLLLVSTVGQNSQCDWLALSSSLPLVRTEGEPYSNYRESWKGQILEARSYGDDYPWVVKLYEKCLNRRGGELFHPDWDKLNVNNRQYSCVARACWLEVVLSKPLQFLLMTIKTIGIALSSSGTPTSRFTPAVFWTDMDKSVLLRWSRNPNYFNRLSGVDISLAIYVAKSVKNHLIRFSHSFNLFLITSFGLIGGQHVLTGPLEQEERPILFLFPKAAWGHGARQECFGFHPFQEASVMHRSTIPLASLSLCLVFCR